MKVKEVSTIIGFDTGTHFTGVSVVDLDITTKKWINVSTATIDPREINRNCFYYNYDLSDVSVRSEMVISGIDNILRHKHMDHAYIEDAFFSRFSPASYGTLNTLIGRIEAYFRSRGVTTSRISVASAKSTIGAIKHNTEVKETVKQQLEQHPMLKHWINNSMSEHELDAILLAYAGWVTYIA